MSRRSWSLPLPGFIVITVVLLLVVGGSGGYAFLMHGEVRAAQAALIDAEDRSVVAQDQHDQRVAQEQAAVAVEAAAEAEAAEQAREDSFAADYGFAPTGTPGLYMQWAPTSEYTCGYWDCAALWLLSTSATCYSMIYVEANIMSGSTVVGFTNDTVGSLAPEETAVVLLENYSGVTGDFQLTDINCI